MTHRGHALARLDPGGFRCLVCRTYVTGTPSGHCPRCGFVPPAAPALATAPKPGSWPILIALVIALVLLVRGL